MGTVEDAFAELGAEFGLSHPSGRCLGAIWRADAPRCADDLTESLGLSRSNVSTALKELRAWGLVSLLRRPGDRKEYFTAPANPWELTLLLFAARRQRVMAPMLERLLRIGARSADPRAAVLHETAAAIDAWLEQLGRLSPNAFARTVGAPSANGGKKKKKKKG